MSDLAGSEDEDGSGAGGATGAAGGLRGSILRVGAGLLSLTPKGRALLRRFFEPDVEGNLRVDSVQVRSALPSRRSRTLVVAGRYVIFIREEPPGSNSFEVFINDEMVAHGVTGTDMEAAIDAAERIAVEAVAALDAGPPVRGR